MSDPSYLTDVYGENYVKSQLLNALVMQNLVDNVPVRVIFRSRLSCPAPCGAGHFFAFSP